MLLGVNLAVASVLMQGCKATKPRGGEQPPQSRPAAQQRPAQQTAPKTAAQHDIEATRYVEPKAQPQTAAKPQTPPAQPQTSAQPQTPAQQQPAQPADKTAQGATAKPAQPQADAKALPAPEPEYTEYVVKRGDMLSRICAKHGIKQRDVLKLNPGLDPNRLFAGKKIRLPGVLDVSSAAPAKSAKDAKEPAKEPKDAKAAPAKDAKPAAKGDAANVKPPATKKSAYQPYEGPTKEYVVKSGDQIGKIALAHGITARALKELNGLPDSNIRVGQKLKVPAEKVKADEKPADAAAAKDAKKDDVKKDEAKAEAKSDDAKAEVKGEVKADAKDDAKKDVKDEAKKDDAKADGNAEPAPAAETPAPAAPLTYVVKEGEDTVAIAINFGISPSALMDLNDLQPTDKLRPGQVLKLPPDAKIPASESNVP